MKRYKVRHCIQTCSACPSQWDISTNKGEYIYARYRWGVLTVTLDPWKDDVVLYTERHGDGLDGVMDTSEMKRHTASVLDWGE